MAMTTNGLSSKLIRNIIRRVNTPSPTTTLTTPRFRSAQRTTINTTSTTILQPPSPPPVNAAGAVTDDARDTIFDFDDTKGLFSSVSTGKLLRSAANLNLAAVEPVVDLGMWVMRSRVMHVGLLREIVLGVIKHTSYEHFVAGADLEETGRTVQKLWESGLRGMLDYGLEHAVDNQSCDTNALQFVKTVESTQSLPPSSVSFVVVKITAICPISLLKRVSDLLRWEYKNPTSTNLPWKLKTLAIFSESSPFYHTLQKPSPLTPEEEHDLELAHQRLVNICNKSIECNVPVVIDAEDTSIQPGIDYFTYSASVMYNKGQKPLIFGTIQAYLKDAGERLFETKKAADKMGLPVGFKLVRGAYMWSESKLADSLGVESPIHNSIGDTHNCYNKCAEFVLDEVSNGPGGLILATHNLESAKLAAQKARDLGIGKDSEKLEFASLYGMSEAMTFGLRNAGFGVSKYLPFGPVDQIMPYLLRRAEENKGLLSSSNLDRQLMMKELKRRMKAYVGQGLEETENQFKSQAGSVVKLN
ncbi:putative proline dehydrogenase [Helianthus annuus]|uniref:Proline dehydrogenase n=1 Tax=Helianthus annuus TaxID=4232 RepID=A0A251T832_HELAN|nr:proline dehydrogenase 2, mitochondrial [Helianthus annuus]KAF5779434.1 putative proline dehydrogenase [Helianthus annuus]KAJ0490688.1 putative proline dehydrogenase [Helianthus annuus]KAJ0494983.1 putative proline dehydrogenase [Helianthus annuus]KAJ0506609.1 putative proline dehydrogenase [Helianthus annuus]KAJ0676283.1 putative proline dehydrogenase [Helianthus annuus]